MIDLLSRLGSTLLRIVLMLFGLVMVAVVMAFGAAAGVVLIGWALVRGRSAAPIAFRWNDPLDWRRRRDPATGPISNSDVFDVDMREIDPGPAHGAPQPPLTLPPR